MGITAATYSSKSLYILNCILQRARTE